MKPQSMMEELSFSAFARFERGFSGSGLRAEGLCRVKNSGTSRPLGLFRL